MMRFVLVRALQLVPVAFGITLVMFFLLRIVPGDPAKVALGVYATPERLADLRHAWGLDRPLTDQYVTFLGLLVHGDLGYSYFYRQPALSVVLERLPPELFLIAYAVALTILIGVPLGVLAALRQERIADHLTRALMMFGLSLPAYWVGIILLLVFGLWLRILPVGGYGNTFPEHLVSLFLPSVTIALGMAPLVIRALRASVIEMLQADHVDMARSKGLQRSSVLLRHVLRPALIPTVTVLGINIGLLIGGTLIIESVFAIPGLGQLLVMAVSSRDFPVVQAVTVVFAVLVVSVNLLTDVVVASLDPRARQAMRA
jgi:peptide/nickel transport system permease protein